VTEKETCRIGFTERATPRVVWDRVARALEALLCRRKRRSVNARRRGGILAAVLLAGLALSSLEGWGAGGDEMFTGTWTADLTLAAVQTSPITAFRSRLDCQLNFGPLVLSTRSDFDVDGWLWQSLEAASNVGFFSLEADVLYAPDPWAFCYASGFVKFDFQLTYYVGFLGSVFGDGILRGSVLEIGSSFAGVQFQGLLFLGATLDGILFEPAPSYAACDAATCCVAPSPSERYYEVLPVQSDSLLFTGARLTFQSYLCYDVTLVATTEVSPTGFEFQEFQAEIWSIGPVPINLDVLLHFEMQSKSLTLEPKLGLGDRQCYGRVLVELITPGPIGLIEGFSVYGLDLFLETPGFAFRSLSLLDTEHFSLYRADSLSLADAIWIDEIAAPGVCGHAGEALADYWEIVGIAAYRGDPDGRVLSFLALSFFGESDSLFDWMRTEFRVELSIMEDLAIRSTVILSSDGISEWSLGMRVAW
jgi:hypothetical protein